MKFIWKKEQWWFSGLLLLQAQVPLAPQVWIYLRTNLSVRMLWIFMNMVVFWINIIAIFVSRWSVNWMLLARAEQQLKQDCSKMDICSQTVPVDKWKLKEHGGLWSSVIKGDQTDFCLCSVSGANAINAGGENSLLSECWIGKLQHLYIAVKIVL